MVERVTVNHDVPGSSPGPGAVAEAEVVKAPGCGPGGKGFESPQSPSMGANRSRHGTVG